MRLLCRCVLRVLFGMGVFKRLFSGSFKDRVKAWLFWKSCAGMLDPDRRGASAPPDLDPGVNFFGFFDSSTGLGEGVRSAAKAAGAAGIPFVRIAVTEDELFGSAAGGRPAANPYAVNWCHVNPSHSGQLVSRFGPEAFAGRVNVGYWVWEMKHLPRMWDVSYRYYDEIWTPSEFSREALAERSPVPVRVVPHALEIEPPPGDWRGRFGVPEGRFAFLVMFDMGSTAERKNPMAAVRAFRDAGAADEGALLIVKTRRPEDDLGAYAELRRALSGADSILIGECISREETLGLVSAADCLVSLHRAEGFGLVPAQAMAFGRPVIATGYSANMEYMTAANSYPVGYRMVRMTRPVGPYPGGDEWAEPDAGHAAEQVRAVLRARGAASRKGERARAEMTERFAPEAVGRLIRSRLEGLGLDFGSTGVGRAAGK